MKSIPSSSSPTFLILWLNRITQRPFDVGGCVSNLMMLRKTQWPSLNDTFILQPLNQEETAEEFWLLATLPAGWYMHYQYYLTALQWNLTVELQSEAVWHDVMGSCLLNERGWELTWYIIINECNYVLFFQDVSTFQQLIIWDQNLGIDTKTRSEILKSHRCFTYYINFEFFFSLYL